MRVGRAPWGSASLVSALVGGLFAALGMAAWYALKQWSWGAMLGRRTGALVWWSDMPWWGLAVVPAIIACMWAAWAVAMGQRDYASGFSAERPRLLLASVFIPTVLLGGTTFWASWRSGVVIYADRAVITQPGLFTRPRSIDLRTATLVEVGCATTNDGFIGGRFGRRGPSQTLIYRLHLGGAGPLEVDNAIHQLGEVAWTEGVQRLDRRLRDAGTPRRIHANPRGRQHWDQECLASLRERLDPASWSRMVEVLGIVETRPRSPEQGRTP